jgi:chemotaxis protein methyltransferase CheR
MSEVDEEDGSDLETLEIELLLTAVARRYGYDFRNYAPASLRRRIRRAMEIERVTSPSQLQDRVLRDPAALSRLVTGVAIHVTSMFRDPTFYRALRERIVPMLRTWPFLRVWVAGCSTGEEAYSIAILLHEAGLYERSRVYATDLSPDLLVRAKHGIYPLDAMKSYAVNYRMSGGEADFSSYWRTDDDNAILRDHLRKNLVFSQHNLASDGSFNEFHLILCRNVLIYFEQPLKDRVHELIHASLIRFGVLALGLRESVAFSSRSDCYEPIDSELRLYRKAQ